MPGTAMTPPLGPQAASDLTRSILARTSGSPCQRLQALACAFVDGALEPGQGALVRAHLDHCAGCAALVAALRESSTILATLAGADPGPGFTRRVLAATSLAPPCQDEGSWRSTWARLLHRPRICLEAAYLGAAAGLVGFALPVPCTGSLPALVEPFKASGQPVKASGLRVAGLMVQAERHTTASLKGAFLPLARQGGRVLPATFALGRRGLTRARGLLNSRRVEETSSLPANL